jgi:hypothetical protein
MKYNHHTIKFFIEKKPLCSGGRGKARYPQGLEDKTLYLLQLYLNIQTGQDPYYEIIVQKINRFLTQPNPELFQ